MSKEASRSRGKNNSWMVDRHGRSGYSKARLFLSQDGKTGFAIKGKDLISVYSTKRGGAMATVLAHAVARGARTLDCYGGGLQNMYARFGAKAIAQVKFNEEYAPRDWDKERRPSIVAKTLPSSLNRLVKAYNPGARIDLSRVRMIDKDPDTDYDTMLRIRDRALGRRSGALALVNG